MSMCMNIQVDSRDLESDPRSMLFSARRSLVVLSILHVSRALLPPRALLLPQRSLAPRASIRLALDSLLANPRITANDTYAEESRQYRRTVYMHDEWIKHRSSDRFFRNMITIGQSGVTQNLGDELVVFTSIATAVVGANMLLQSYTDLEGVKHAGALAGLWQW